MDIVSSLQTIDPALLEQCWTLLQEAERVLIGAGAGLSIDAGIDYTNPISFAEYFPAMVKRGYHALYEAMGVHKEWSEALQWGYHAAHVNLICFQTPAHPIYTTLLKLVEGKDYFVLTSNVDEMFAKSGFEQQRLFTPQGSYARYQCLLPCTTQTWSIKPIIDRILPTIDPASQEITDASVIPRCPNCGEAVFANVRAGNWFVKEPYLEQQEHFLQWLNKSDAGPLLLVEIGAGWSTPGVIRWPMEQIMAHVPQTHLIRVNPQHPHIPTTLRGKATSVQARGIDLIMQLSSRTEDNQ